MITVIDVLESLNVKNWTLRGDALTETKFHEGFTQNGSKNPNDWSITWSDVLAKKTELQAAEPMGLLRIQRNQLLQQTDWRMTTDYPYADQAQWATYRTALRDLPATASPTLDENEQLTNVDWPTAPDQT